MITSYLQGGLGNQMFQISAAYSLSLKLNVEYSFDFNSSFVSTQGHKANRYKDNLFKNVSNKLLNFNNFKIYREPSFKYNELPLIDNLCLLGNFQTEKYFLENKNEVLNLFNFEKENHELIKQFLYKKIGNEKITAIHVRRGDYLDKPEFHPTCDMDYYKKGMDIIGDKKYIIISDDIEWCKNNFLGDDFIFSPFTNEIEDLYLLMNCDNHIISNSSFSWWGAYLCEKENKVVSPKTWFGPQGPQDTEDIYIKNWIKI
jgi:hypothetical protein